MSWPCFLSSSAKALSRRQLPQYILAAPAVNARIFIRSTKEDCYCSKTRHKDLNLFILRCMTGKPPDCASNQGVAMALRADKADETALWGRRTHNCGVFKGDRTIATCGVGGRFLECPWACGPQEAMKPRCTAGGTACRTIGASSTVLAIVLLAALLLPAAVSGQSIRGTVRESGGKAMEGVAVRLVNQETNRLRSVLTGAAGEFTIADLAPGPYRVTAERDGYARQERDFELLLNQEIRLEITLPPGQRTETVQDRKSTRLNSSH